MNRHRTGMEDTIQPAASTMAKETQRIVIGGSAANNHANPIKESSAWAKLHKALHILGSFHQGLVTGPWFVAWQSLPLFFLISWTVLTAAQAETAAGSALMSAAMRVARMVWFMAFGSYVAVEWITLPQRLREIKRIRARLRALDGGAR